MATVSRSLCLSETSHPPKIRPITPLLASNRATPRRPKCFAIRLFRVSMEVKRERFILYGHSLRIALRDKRKLIHNQIDLFGSTELQHIANLGQMQPFQPASNL